MFLVLLPFAILFFLTIIVAAVAYSLLSWAFVITKLWVWFLTMAFGITAISFSQAVAIVFILGVIKTLINPNYKEVVKDNYKNIFNKDGETKDKTFYGVFAITLIAPWLTLLVGWIIKCIFISVAL